MSPAVQRALEKVYAAFGDVPKPANIGGCPCCIDRKNLDPLLAKPLRSLSPDDLTKYAASALLTVGEPEDYIYFLPRILEILMIEPLWWPSVEIVARTIDSAGLREWPDTRRKAITEYFDTVLADLFAREAGSEFNDWLCALGALGVNLGPFLTRLEANGERLIEFYEQHSQSLVRGKLANGFWDNAPAARRQVVDWFRSAETQHLIAQQYGLA